MLCDVLRHTNTHRRKAQRTQFSMPLNVFIVFLWLFTATHKLTDSPHKNSLLPDRQLTRSHPPCFAFSQPLWPQQEQSIALCLSCAHFSSVCLHDPFLFLSASLPIKHPNVALCPTNFTVMTRHFSPFSQESHLEKSKQLDMFSPMFKKMFWNNNKVNYLSTLLA